jgi:hypothetical protein
MYLVGLDAIEPGTLGRQPAGDQLNDSFPLVLRLQRGLVMLLDPGAHMLADMPGGVMPDQHERVMDQSFELLAEPLQKVDGHLTH